MSNAARVVGKGGFYLPRVYEKRQKEVEAALNEGEIDYADLTQWSFPDEFLCFILQSNLLQFMDTTYPSPRVKNEIPIWFLMNCQFVMRLFQTGSYHHLEFLLNAGSILTRFGFNVGAREIGFNAKNKGVRKTAVHADTVRKFFKDSDAGEIRSWYCGVLQQWFRNQKAFHHHGLFVLDQSHLVVPDNPNYVNSHKMPVDEHGQLYPNLSKLSPEEKRGLKYHRCYTLSTLLNVSLDYDQFHVGGYDLGSGNEDELTQADRLIPAFCHKQPGLMKLLIVDRGYIDSDLIGKIKRDHEVDTLIPLRSNMGDHHESVDLARMKGEWSTLEETRDPSGFLLCKKEIASAHDLNMWDGLDTPLHGCTTRYTVWDPEKKQYDERYAVLVSTKKYQHVSMMVRHYDLRMQTEERFRQFKRAWYINEFPSPHASLVESHVCFTLFTYSLMQMYLRRKDLRDNTGKMIATLRRDERMGKDAVLVYAATQYGVFDLDDYTVRVAGLEETPRERLIRIMSAQKEARIKRES